MKHCISIIAAAFILLFASCEKIIDFNGSQTKPLLVVNGIQRQGEPARVTVSHSQFFLSNDDDYSVSNAVVKLYINGQYIETLQHTVDTLTYSWSDETSDVYFGTRVLEAGDSVRFEVSAPDFEPVKTGTIIPDVPFVVSFDTSRTETETVSEYYSFTDIDENGDSCYITWTGDTIWPNDISGGRFYFNLRFNDKADELNYYNLSIINGFLTTYSDDFVFASSYLDPFEQIGSALGGETNYYYLRESNPFSDTYFNGKEYNLSFYDYNYTFLYEPSITFEASLSSVDYNYYQYIRTYLQSEDNDGMGSLVGMFSEPTQVYSNVEGGVGIVCSESVASKRSVTISRRRH